MSFETGRVSYSETGFFSKIVLDYTEGADALRPFYLHPPSIEGIEAAIAARKAFATNRSVLTNVLEQQYEGVATSPLVRSNISRLAGADCFTICTAHQPNIFTGHLYFIYKILHAVKLAAHLAEQLPQYHFVPVYYMGSEDADLEELGSVTVDGVARHWQTAQKGAVGRMQADDALLKMLQSIGGQLTVQPHGAELMEMMQACYTKGATIQQATFMLVNRLFANYGLVVLIPDHAALKRQLLPVFADDLYEHRPAAIVEAASEQLGRHYKVQAQPREINLFYLEGDIRERIEQHGGSFRVLNSDRQFTRSEMDRLLDEHPERFSPNVILRGLYQETILPNLAFVGGGGELAYWLQLKTLFEHYKIPYPVQVLRNSFMVVETAVQERMEKLQLDEKALFSSEADLLNALVQRKSSIRVTLEEEKAALTAFYRSLENTVLAVDATLQHHAAALGTRAMHKLEALEKKMLRAEKRKYEAEQRQLQYVKDKLFPGGSLQERVENFMPFYARHGSSFIDALCGASAALEPVFTILKKNSNKKAE